MRGSVRKKGKRWYYRFDVAGADGKRKQIERVGGSTKKEAQQALEDALAKFNVSGEVQSVKRTSMLDFWQLWRNDYAKGVRLSSLRSRDWAWDRWIKGKLGRFYVEQVAPLDIQNYFNWLQQQGLAENTVSKIYETVKLMFDNAVFPYQLIKVSPVTHIKPPKGIEKKASPTIIEPAEFEKIYAAFNHSVYALPILISYYTGLRRGEVLGLTWDCVDLKKQELKVNKQLIYTPHGPDFAEPKTPNAYRTIPFGNEISGKLRSAYVAYAKRKLRYAQYFDDHKLVCSHSDGRPISPVALSRNFATHLKRHGLPKHHFHELRHSHASLLIRAGVSPKVVQDRLGHASIRTTLDIYTHVVESQRVDATKQFDEYISSHI